MKKNERVCAITKILTDTPGRLIPYGDFCTLLDASKTSVSEDVAVVKAVLENLEMGRVETVAGAAGGVRYLPLLTDAQEKKILSEIAERLAEADRRIPGGFLYYSDILSSPYYVERLGRIIAGRYLEAGVEHVVTTETKGISVALESARFLDVPMTVIRRTNKVTEGTTTSMNYVSGSTNKINTMYLSRRVDLEGRRVLIIDDFMKGGGTARGMVNLLEEVGAIPVGPCVIVATKTPQEKLVNDYAPLLRILDDESIENSTRVEICGRTC